MNHIINENEVYCTDDLALAAAVALYTPLQGIDATAIQPQFVFRREADLEKWVEQYQRGKLRVEPQVYFWQLRLLQTTVALETHHDPP